MPPTTSPSDAGGTFCPELNLADVTFKPGAVHSSKGQSELAFPRNRQPLALLAVPSC